MKELYVVNCCRTAIGSFGGSLKNTPAVDMGAIVVKEALKRANVAPENVDELMFGCILTAGQGQNPARQVGVKAGLPYSVPAYTVGMVCGSGMKAVQMAAQAIICGDAEIVVAGGQESMSQSPHFMHMRSGLKMGDGKLVDSMVSDGLTDAYHHYHMGITAENIVEKLGISREAQDALALASQQKAAAARAEGRFDAEIAPVSVPQRKGEPLRITQDEYIKADAGAEALAKLRPAFKTDGTVTAGNASGINDGAAALLLMSAEKAAELGLPPLAAISGYAAAGVAPEIMGLGPVEAVRAALGKAGWQLADVDLIEGNEAFAAQALGVAETLGFDMAKVNVNGGAIALGHPIGASGCRIVVTLLHEMQRRGAHKGLATLCVGGGMGLALALERV